jgi:myo-inositol-1(or 4)-monophosphatase
MGEITKNDTDIVWIIDPIDGTNNFIRGFPHYCISIAIQRKGIVEHGVIYDPCRDELFTASKGDGAQLNGQRIRVSNCVNLEKSVIGTGFAYKRAGIPTEKYLQKFSIFLQECSIRRAGAAALDLAYIASGRLDGFWEMGLKPWDIAAGSILIREAGGFISDDKGEDHYLSSGKVIAGNVKIYPKLLKILSL